MRSSAAILLVFVSVSWSLASGDRSPTPVAPSMHPRGPNVLQLLSEPVSIGDWQAVGEFVNPGARIVGLRVHATEASGEGSWCQVLGVFYWRWTEGEEFFPHVRDDARLPNPTPGVFREYAAYYTISDGHRDDKPLFIFPQGAFGQVRLAARNNCRAIIDSVEVYLEP